MENLKIYNEIKKIVKYNEHIVFFQMKDYIFILGEDVDNISADNFFWAQDKGTLSNMKAIRIPMYNINQIDSPFDDLLTINKKPIAVKVQPAYINEDVFISDKVSQH